MPRTLPSIPSAPAIVAAALLAGCGWFDDPSPDEARLIVQGDPDVPVRIVVSREFVAAMDEVGVTRVELFRSDTMEVVPPFDRTFDIRAAQQFFSEVSRLHTDADVRVRVLLDGEERFNDGGRLIPDAPYRFVFLFNKFVSSTVEVL